MNITNQVKGISLFNIGINAYGQIRRHKKVSIWNQEDPAREVLVGSIINNTSRAGQVVAETLSRGTVIMSCKVEEPSKLCEHPIESGSVITDHKVLLPKTCTITLAMPAYYQNNVIKELNEYFEKSTPLSVHDVGKVYNNMVIVNQPHTTEAKTSERAIFTIEMKEVITVAPQYVHLDKNKVKNAKDASKAKKGVKQAKTNNSIAYDIVNSDMFKNVKENITNFWDTLHG